MASVPATWRFFLFFLPFLHPLNALSACGDAERRHPTYMAMSACQSRRAGTHMREFAAALDRVDGSDFCIFSISPGTGSRPALEKICANPFQYVCSTARARIFGSDCDFFTFDKEIISHLPDYVDSRCRAE